MKILVATHNKGKLKEFAEILTDLDIEWLTLDDVGITDEIEETGATFEDNARLKAEGYFKLSGIPTLADDSGLEVDALNGEPGVYSARYGGPGLNSVDRYNLLLKNMEGIPTEERTARFRCVIAIAAPDREMVTADGVREGLIAHEPRGSNGFGYDPVFWVSGYKMTLAEMASEAKNQISHRALALKAIRPMLEALVRSGSDS